MFKPSVPVMWTGSHYMPSLGETTNTAEYTALLLGVRAAIGHGVKTLGWRATVYSSSDKCVAF